MPMQESMVKFLLIVVAVLSLAMGALFLIIPEWYVQFSEAEAANLAWLRLVGANLVAVQGFGVMLAVFRRRDTNPLLGITAIATTVVTGVLWYSLFAGEFTAAALWTIVVPGIFSTASAVVLWAAWASRRRSLRGGAAAPSQLPPDAPADIHHQAGEGVGAPGQAGEPAQHPDYSPGPPPGTGV